MRATRSPFFPETGSFMRKHPALSVATVCFFSVSDEARSFQSMADASTGAFFGRFAVPPPSPQFARFFAFAFACTSAPSHSSASLVLAATTGAEETVVAAAAGGAARGPAGTSGAGRGAGRARRRAGCASMLMLFPSRQRFFDVAGAYIEKWTVHGRECVKEEER